MPRLRSSLLVLLVAAVSVAQNSETLLTPAMERVGRRLACLCGGCNNSVVDCPMLHCEYAGPARQKIARMLAAGDSDQQIIDSFVREYGTRALITPPASGFNRMAWIMPWVAVVLGLMAVGYWIRRLSSKKAAESLPQVDPAVVARYRDTIEKDLEKLE
jgi:cytochrome c-type biogenesis protein CcmH/NrfF